MWLSTLNWLCAKCEKLVCFQYIVCVCVCVCVCVYERERERGGERVSKLLSSAVHRATESRLLMLPIEQQYPHRLSYQQWLHFRINRDNVCRRIEKQSTISLRDGCVCIGQRNIIKHSKWMLWLYAHPSEGYLSCLNVWKTAGVHSYLYTPSWRFCLAWPKYSWWHGEPDTVVALSSERFGNTSLYLLAFPLFSPFNWSVTIEPFWGIDKIRSNCINT